MHLLPDSNDLKEAEEDDSEEHRPVISRVVHLRDDLLLTSDGHGREVNRRFSTMRFGRFQDRCRYNSTRFSESLCRRGLGSAIQF